MTYSIPIRVGRQVVGEVQGDTFHKRLRASVHFLRIPPAIAFDVMTLDDAERAGARRVEVTDLESGAVYQVPISTIRARGFPVSRGVGTQIALDLTHWRRAGDPEQLELWGVSDGR